MPDAPEGEAPLDPNQPFQLDGVDAVTHLFDGEPQGAEYAVIHLGAMEGLVAGQERTELGAWRTGSWPVGKPI